MRTDAHVCSQFILVELVASQCVATCDRWIPVAEEKRRRIPDKGFAHVPDLIVRVIRTRDFDHSYLPVSRRSLVWGLVRNFTWLFEVFELPGNTWKAYPSQVMITPISSIQEMCITSVNELEFE
jgi:hypothetical protein